MYVCMYVYVIYLCLISSIYQRRVKFSYHNGKITSRLKAPPPYNITLMKGPVHIVASRDFVEYVIAHKVSLSFLDWLNDTDFQDETFFPSLNYNRQLGVPGAYAGNFFYYRYIGLPIYKKDLGMHNHTINRYVMQSPGIRDFAIAKKYSQNFPLSSKFDFYANSKLFLYITWSSMQLFAYFCEYSK